jgi:pimeloyl-ACP methyl ester carboxylesterase
VILVKGRVVFEGASSELLAQPDVPASPLWSSSFVGGDAIQMPFSPSRPNGSNIAGIGIARTGRPTLVFLHEGLGSVSMWRDFPARVARATGCSAIVFSRRGYGNSEPLTEPRTVRYMHDEAEQVLPQVIERLAIDRPILIGHSDGGSIALIYAATAPKPPLGVVTLAAHVLVEDISIQSIAEAREKYLTTDLPKKLARHHADADSAFWGWNDIWLAPDFRSWNIEECLPRILVRCSRSRARRRVRYDGADAAHRRAGSRCRARHAAGVRSFGAQGPAGRSDRCHCALCRARRRMKASRSTVAPRHRESP